MEKHFGVRNHFNVNHNKDIPMEKYKKEFEVGEIYMINLSYIFTPESTIMYEINFDYSVMNNFNTYTLVKCLGDNKFEEYYTGTTIIASKKEKLDYSEPVQYYGKMLELIENPFHINEEAITKINTSEMYLFAKNKGYEENIAKKIIESKENVKNELKNKLSEHVSKDYERALLENAIFDFKKGNSYAKKTLSLKKEN